IMDLGSRNGTFVNDQRVIMPVTLEAGARIRIADYELVFDQDTGEEEGEHVDATLAALSNDGTHAVLSVAILVCDIRGFTPMAEKLGEQGIAHLLGNWFRDTGNIVHSAGGIIDKYIGDALLAYWPARDQEGTESAICLDSALAILQLAANRTWGEPDQPFRVGIALHFGRVTSSNIGQVAVRDATIIGDAVNTAFRLEGVMKSLNQRLVMSQDFVTVLPEGRNLTDFGEFQLKGKSHLVRVYGLEGLDNDSQRTSTNDDERQR
ncbi:MAG TPA: adenylate/guanylate cyclase domain-containing protein, partial [Chthoniobacterales bacterium]|nr:adenylate/guanylate cyclase domain-containing protein [Chthoniobacterales bacterium]